MARNDPQVNFRMPQVLKDKLEQSAKDNGRSITSEVVIRLEDSFNSPKIIGKDDKLDLILAEIQKLQKAP